MRVTDDLTLFTHHFADDQTTIAQEKEDLEFRQGNNEKWGLRINLE